MSGPFYIGVDVGTSSVRAALFNRDGEMLDMATHPIKIWEPQPGFYEQSSDNIWSACCIVIKSITAPIDKASIHGLGFDATCSMVVLDTDCKPLSVSPTGEAACNIVMWMDHRASAQAQHINSTKHEVLRSVGGSISLEMQVPKLLWLKENLRSQCWDKAGHFFDLPDFLTWKATGSFSRSLCSLVCKWTYQANGEGGDGSWSDSFLQQTGLEDLIKDNYAKIGNHVLAPGQPCGSGLSQEAAANLGLRPGMPIGTSILDAYAGGIGVLGCTPVSMEGFSLPTLQSRLGLICGTSTCHMILTSDPLFVPGVWGPYFSAMVPGLWSLEGGQSATGKLIDHIVETHPAYSEVKASAEKRETHVHNLLNAILSLEAGRLKIPEAELTKHLHMWPDYHGNRSPVADPSLQGMICGLTLASGAEDLAHKYLAAIQALAFGTMHILNTVRDCGHETSAIYICGGLSKNPVYVQTHADVTGLPIVMPKTQESVLLGSALLAACASRDFKTIQDAMSYMGGSGEVVLPNLKNKEYYEKKYKVFLRMLDHQREYQQLMNS